MDIKQAVDACAALTLGKDMVFRDYAQGAFRMRGTWIDLRMIHDDDDDDDDDDCSIWYARKTIFYEKLYSISSIISHHDDDDGMYVCMYVCMYVYLL